jgi:hypothetical protein
MVVHAKHTGCRDPHTRDRLHMCLANDALARKGQWLSAKQCTRSRIRSLKARRHLLAAYPACSHQAMLA